MSYKDVHTEHCCIVHGCKYMDKDCTVVTKQKPQSHRCEDCYNDEIDPTKADPETSIFTFKEGSYYQTSDDIDKKLQKCLMYVMGHIKDAQGETQAICDLWMFSMLTFSYVSSVQGTSKIRNSDWVEVTKDEYDALKATLK